MAHKVEPRVGGWLLVESRSGCCLEQIDKITDGHIISGLSKYNLLSGVLEKPKPFFEVTATAISDEKANEIGREYRVKREVEEMKNRINKLVQTADHATLSAVIEILQKPKP
jgi:hypothetical protein